MKVPATGSNLGEGFCRPDGEESVPILAPPVTMATLPSKSLDRCLLGPAAPVLRSPGVLSR